MNYTTEQIEIIRAANTLRPMPMSETDPRLHAGGKPVRVARRRRASDDDKPWDKRRDKGTLDNHWLSPYRGNQRVFICAVKCYRMLRRKSERLGYVEISKPYRGDTFAMQAMREAVAGGVAAFFGPIDDSRGRARRRKFAAYRAAWAIFRRICVAAPASLSDARTRETVDSMRQQYPAWQGADSEGVIELTGIARRLAKAGEGRNALRRISDDLAHDIAVRYLSARPSRRAMLPHVRSIITSARYGRRGESVYKKMIGE